MDQPIKDVETSDEVWEKYCIYCEYLLEEDEKEICAVCKETEK